MKISAGELGCDTGSHSESTLRQIAPWLAGGVAVSVAAAAYARNRGRDSSLESASLLPYCQDIARGMEGYEYAVVGGLPIDAFNHEGSAVDPDSRSITVSEEFEAKLLRNNGSVRDYDIFMLGAEGSDFQTLAPKAMRRLKSTVGRTVAERAKEHGHPSPVVSVFPFDDESGLFHTATVLGEDGRLTLAHGDSKQELPEDALQTWELNFPDGSSVKILSPWEQYWRSVVRFASGPKAKDLGKLEDMLTKLRSTPGLAEQEAGDLCQAYAKHYEAMLRGNSRNALNAEWGSDNREWARVADVGSLVLARRLLTVGQRSERITQLVQTLPNVFDRFVGVK